MNFSAVSPGPELLHAMRKYVKAMMLRERNPDFVFIIVKSFNYCIAIIKFHGK